MEFKEFKRVRYETPAFDFAENKLGFAFHKNQPGYSDISAHLPLLEYLASKCIHITEFGTRDGFSTCAFMSGLQKAQGKLVNCAQYPLLPPYVPAKFPMRISIMENYKFADPCRVQPKLVSNLFIGV